MLHDDYIFKKFCEFNKRYEIENGTKLLTLRTKNTRRDFVKTLNEEQYELFRFYDNIRFLSILAEREKFYTEGFLSGLNSKDKK